MRNYPNFGFTVNYVTSAGVTVSPGAGGLSITGYGPTVAQSGGATNLWSDPATWGGSVPLATDVVTIAAGHTVYLDTTSAVALSLDIQGSLIAVQTASVGLTTGYINVGAAGVLQIGTEATPYPAAYTATITLNGAEVGRATRTVLSTSMGFTNNGVGRSLQVQAGGTLSLIGVAPTYKRTKLNASAAAGTNTFTLADSTGWLAGDDIVMGTTDFYGVSMPEKLTLTANASGTSIQTTATIASARWGALQYVTDSGMSLTAGTLTGAAVGTPTTLDERAFIINLRRNIIVQGVNDTAWTSSKFGAHCMFMSGGATSGTAVFPSIKIDGVRFNRVGQAGAIGRYPIHWHMMSYNMSSGSNVPSPDGVFIGNVVGHYAKNCAFDSSGQRMITIHGTHGVTLDANVGWDITGHAIFLEDGSEQDNVISNNVVMKVRAPTAANKLIMSDFNTDSGTAAGSTDSKGVACIWNTNPQNTFTGNWLNDSSGAGLWSIFSERCFGLSTNVALNPNTTTLTLIDNNTSMGHMGAGALTNHVVLDDKGTLGEQTYFGSFLTAPIMRYNLFKNSAGGYSNRINSGQYQAYTAADNAGMDVFGQSNLNNSFMVNTLSVAESLNNTNSKRLSSYRAAFATYHEQLNFHDCTLVGYSYIQGTTPDTTSTSIGGGIFRMWDLYIAPMVSFSQNYNFKLINCEVPFRTLPPNYDGVGTSTRHWALAGAIRDTGGIFGIAGKYWVYDMPFFTYGATSPTYITPAHTANGVYTVDKYYGAGSFVHSATLLLDSTLAISVVRQDSSGTEVGRWEVLDGATSSQLSIMRNFAAHHGGRFALSTPDAPTPNYFDFLLDGQGGVNDIFMVGLPFGAAYVPRVYQEAFGIYSRDATGKINLDTRAGAISSGRGRFLTSTGSLANVQADTTGTLFYRDTANNMVWLQVKCYPLIQAALGLGSYGAPGTTQYDYKSVNVVVGV